MQSLEQLYHAGQLTEETGEGLLSLIRDNLGNMETCVEEMMNLLYQADVYLSDPSTQLRAGFNPKEALDHVSAAVHVCVLQSCCITAVVAHVYSPTVLSNRTAD